MANISSQICFKLKEARRAAGIRQSDLALELGCKQSALSMFEQGQPTKLNSQVVEKWAAKFAIDLKESFKTATTESAAIEISTAAGTGFCPNPTCPSNHAYAVGGKKFYLPNREQADPVGGKYCAICGELLERRCSNCGALVHAGAVCSICGERYIVT